MILDSQRYLWWLLYAGSAVVYTGLVFRGELPREGGAIFSQRNARSGSAILTVHIVFLAILLLAIRGATLIFPKLPDWLTATVSGRGAPISLFEFLFIVAVVCMHFLERRWLFVEKASSEVY